MPKKIIYAEDAIKAVHDLYAIFGSEGEWVDRKDVFEAIDSLPSAQPERKKGKWVYNSPVTMKCDQCGLVIKDWDWHRFKICPNCGAYMRGEQDD